MVLQQYVCSKTVYSSCCTIALQLYYHSNRLHLYTRFFGILRGSYYENMLVWGIQIKTFISENQVKVMTHMKI